MRLAVLGFVAALLTAPLAAQAAQPPAMFSATLQAAIADRLTYERTALDEECTSRRTGEGGRELSIRSIRPTVIEVTPGQARVVYRPAAVAALRVGETKLAGSWLELRRCRFLPPERSSGTCDRASGSVRRMRAGFRSGRHAIVFRPGSSGDVTPCGLDQGVPGGWLDLFSGRIDHDVLLSGRSLRVLARAEGTRERTIAGDPTLKVTQRTTVRWTLTFRRLL